MGCVWMTETTPLGFSVVGHEELTTRKLMSNVEAKIVEANSESGIRLESVKIVRID